MRVGIFAPDPPTWFFFFFFFKFLTFLLKSKKVGGRASPTEKPRKKEQISMNCSSSYARKEQTRLEDVGCRGKQVRQKWAGLDLDAPPVAILTGPEAPLSVV